MKIKRILTVILSLTLLVSLFASLSVFNGVSAADNLAANGDLEMGSVSGWEIDSATLEKSVTYAGNYSLKLTATSAYSGAAYKIVPVKKNATVTVSFYYRYASDPGSALYHVYTYQGVDASVGPYSDADASLIKPTGCDPISTWKQVSYTFNSGNYNNIYLKFCPGGSGGSVCYIDNLVVTASGGTMEEVAPYLTSFGTKYNRPANNSNNLIKNGGFESTVNAGWNTDSFIKDNLSVVGDPTAPEGSKSLFLDAGNTADPVKHTFPVAVESGMQYTFSAWVKSPRLSATNNATATFGVANAQTGKFLVYDYYNGNGYGSASLSTDTMQLMATSPDGQWHLRSVTFYSGTATTVNVMVYGAESQLYLDDLALYKSAYGVEYISPLRTGNVTATTNTGNKYCADTDSLVPNPQMSGRAAQEHWSSNPAWRNGFLSFSESADEHGTVLKYHSASGLGLTYIDWVDVLPDTSYTFTIDVKCTDSADNTRIALLDDNILSPVEFYTIQLSSVNAQWNTYSVTFNTGVYSRVGLAIVDFGGEVMIDNVRLFENSKGLAEEPEETVIPTLKPVGGDTSVMEMADGPTNVVYNGGFEEGYFYGFDIYQHTDLSATAAHSGANGAHLKGDGSWGALVEKTNIPVEDGKTYTLSYWYKANASGANVTLKGTQSGTQYAYEWASKGAWTNVTATFTVAGDTSVIFNVCGGGDGVAEDVYLDDISLLEDTDGLLGIAFMMELQAYDVTRNEMGVANLTNATVDAYGDGEKYRLVQMGAVMTNSSVIGTNPYAFTRGHVAANEVRLVDVPAVYLNSTDRFSTTFAVRVVNVPTSSADVVVYARPYYVFEKDDEQITVYGDIYSRSYNNSGNDIFLD